MGKYTGIEWTNHTMNFWWGCYKVSPGCKHCYAETLSSRYKFNVWGKNAPRRVFKPGTYKKPYNWNKAAEDAGVPARVFCGSMMDWAEDYNPAQTTEPFSIPPNAIATWDIEPYRKIMFETIENTPWLDWQLLTKRADRIMDTIPEAWRTDFPDNVWPMVSVENQAQAWRLEELLKVPSRVRGASIEPLITGPLDISEYLGKDKINWIIIGGESGPGARGLHISWVEALVEQGKAADIPIFVKQMGTVYAKEYKTIHNKAGDPAEWRSSVNVREFPESYGR